MFFIRSLRGRTLRIKTNTTHKSINVSFSYRTKGLYLGYKNSSHTVLNITVFTPVGMPSILNPINTLCVIGKRVLRLSVCFWMLNGL